MKNGMPRTLAATAAAILFATTAMPASAQNRAWGDEIPVPSEDERTLLKDAIDIHAHLDPDTAGPHSVQAARRLDVVDMANRAKTAGMRGFVIKQHDDQTAALAYLTRKAVSGVEVFGMLCLNLAEGGLRPETVYHFTEVKGGLARLVSMPTWDAENDVVNSRNPARPSVALSRDGELLPETKAVIAAVAAARSRDIEAGLALATGHASAQEALMIIREARRQGIERIVVTHATGHPVDMTMEQMKEAVSLGALIEFSATFLFGRHSSADDIRDAYDAIRELGPEHVILSSDAGQMGNPYPDDMLAITAGKFREMGMTTAEIYTIMAENPAKLLGIPPPAAQ